MNMHAAIRHSSTDIHISVSMNILTHAYVNTYVISLSTCNVSMSSEL